MEKIEDIFTKERADSSLFSAIFCGNRGVGKRSRIYNIIKKCSPKELWSKIESKQSCDILEFYGDEGIQVCKEKLQDFDTLPKELPHRWLVFNNIEYASREVNNFLLKLVEERKNFHVFITSTDKSSVCKALLSRLHIYLFPSLTKEEITKILQENKQKSILLPQVDKFTFRSIFELETYFTLNFEETFHNLYLKKAETVEFIQRIDSFLQKVKELVKVEQDAVILFFLEFLLVRLSQTPEYSGIHYQFLLNKTKEKFIYGLFIPGTHYSVNKENQFKSFLLSLFLLKKLGA